MARPKTYTEQRVTTAVRLPEALYERLRQAAESRDTSLNHLLVKAADFYLDRLPPLDAVDRAITERAS